MRCNCCCFRGGQFRSFGRRARVRCPRCGSLERHRAAAAVLVSHRAWYAGRRVFHVAAEGCLTRVVAPLAFEYVAPKRCDLTRLDRYGDGVFDLVLHNHVIEHVLDDRAAFRQTRRVLAPGGRLLLTTPTRESTSETLDGRETPAERLAKWGHRKHWRRYGRADLVDRLREAGFEAGWFDVRDWNPKASKLDDGLVFWAVAP